VINLVVWLHILLGPQLKIVCVKIVTVRFFTTVKK